jgi:outer membrane protein TolC
MWLVWLLVPLQLSAQDRVEAIGVEGGLRVRTVVERTLATSADRARAVAEVSAARADVDRATLAFVPRLGLSASYTRLSEIDPPLLGYVAAPANQAPGVIAPGDPLVSVPLSFPSVVDQTAFRAELAIPATDYILRVLPSRSAAAHAVDAAEAGVDAAERRIALEAETLYWNWVRARLAIRAAQQGLERARAHLGDTESLVEAGLAIDADRARAQAQVASMTALVENAEHLRDAIADRLRTIMHVRAIPDAIGERLDDRADEEIDVDRSLARALDRRSDLRALDARIDALESQRTAVAAGYFPRVDVVGEVLVANPNPRVIPSQEEFDTTWAVGVRASWQLADTLAAFPAESALDAQIAAAREGRVALTEGIRAEIVEARRRMLDARSALARSEESVRLAERTLAVAGDVYRIGRGTSLAVIDAQTLLVQAEFDRISARVDREIARAAVRHAIEE